jgi:oligoendopeptidase F
MKRTALALALATALAAVGAAQAATAPAAAASAAAPASNPPATWNLAQLYPTDAAWEASRARLESELPQLKALQGTLGASPQSLLAGLDRISAANRELARLYTYAQLKGDENTKITANEARRGQASTLVTQTSTALSWEDSEIAGIGKDRIEQYIAAEPGLAKHAYHLRSILRQAAHVLPPDQEAIVAAAQDPLSRSSRIYDILTNADLPWPKITVHGKTVTLDQETYVSLRNDPDPKIREQVFKAFWPVFKAYSRTIGAIYETHLRGVVFDARQHKYDSVLAARTSDLNTPETVYRTLVAEANAGLPVLQRYLKLRGRLLGLKEQKYSDVYATLAKAPRTYTLAEAEQLTLQGVAPLGEDYVKALGQHFQEGWMDAVPRLGKRSGAYMEPAAYDVHPYVLLSFNGTYDSVSTIAHEWGHAMHSVLAEANQPYETADYGIFVAEIPSTTNEMLLADYVSAHAKTKAEKIYALTQQLEGMRTTFFRQAMFAEFELKTHEAAEKDQPLTGDDLSRIYLELLKRYYGDAQGVMKIEDLYGAEWAYIPHFYTDYYVYQYATCVSAAAYFAEGIEKGDTAMRTRYLDMLKAGGSDDPYLVVKKAGLDMATPAPYRALVQRMSRLLDELDALTAGAAAKEAPAAAAPAKAAASAAK